MIVALATLTAGTPALAQQAANASFFVTSRSIGNGGNLGGLAGAAVSDVGRLVFGAPVPAYGAVFLAQVALFAWAAWLASRLFGEPAPRSAAEIGPLHAASVAGGA